MWIETFNVYGVFHLMWVNSVWWVGENIKFNPTNLPCVLKLQHISNISRFRNNYEQKTNNKQSLVSLKISNKLGKIVNDGNNTVIKVQTKFLLYNLRISFCIATINNKITYCSTYNNVVELVNINITLLCIKLYASKKTHKNIFTIR